MGGGGNRLDSKTLDSKRLDSKDSTLSQSQKLLIIAVPSQDSFLQYCTNGILNMPPHHISRFSDKCLANIAKIFDIKLLTIYHEQVQKEHIDFYKATMWAKLFLRPQLVDMGYLRKFINKFGSFGGNKFIKIPKDAYGHTAIAIYQIKA